MNNTMLAELQPDRAELALPTEQSPLLLRESSPASGRRQRAVARGIFKGDWLTVAVLLACMFTICTIGVIYIAAFARVSWQAQQIAQTDAALATASGENETLVKQVAFLESDYRIAPRASLLKMTQASNSAYIEVTPNQYSGSRQVASAQ